MIATLLAVPRRPQPMTAAAQWPIGTDGQNTHLPETDARTQQSGPGGAGGPTINGPDMMPVAGLRGVLTTMVRGGIPRIPLGPTRVAGRGQRTIRTGKVPQQLAMRQQYQPVASVEQAGDWYEYLR